MLLFLGLMGRIDAPDFAVICSHRICESPLVYTQRPPAHILPEPSRSGLEYKAALESNYSEAHAFQMGMAAIAMR